MHNAVQVSMLRGTVVSDCGFTPAGSYSKSPVIIRSEMDQSHGQFWSGHVALSRVQKVGLCKTVAHLRVGVKPQSLTTVLAYAF